jgi:hypothetical protein
LRAAGKKKLSKLPKSGSLFAPLPPKLFAVFLSLSQITWAAARHKKREF